MYLYSLSIFSNVTITPMLEHSITPKETPGPLAVPPICPQIPQPQATTNLSVSVDLPIADISYKCNDTRFCCLFVWVVCI